jgi:hypothetical protein
MDKLAAIVGEDALVPGREAGFARLSGITLQIFHDME